jgi:hypothetical protein
VFNDFLTRNVKVDFIFKESLFVSWFIFCDCMIVMEAFITSNWKA